MGNERYSMSFTTGSLFHQESVKLAALYLELLNWQAVREKVVAENLLQARTQNTLRRVSSELISRLKTLSTGELEFLLKTTPKEQAYLLWIAICRRYRFIADFARDVLRERYLTLKTDLPLEAFDTFYNRTAEWHPELDVISAVTRGKLRQVLFKILREAELLTKDNVILGATLGPRFFAFLRIPDVVPYLPVRDSELQRMAR